MSGGGSQMGIGKIRRIVSETAESLEKHSKNLAIWKV